MSAIYEVTLRSQYLNQLCINSWNYVNTTPLVSPTALNLLTLMGFIPVGDPAELPATGIFADIRAMVSSGVSFLEVECRELYSLTDFYLAAYSPAVPGEMAGVTAAPFLAYGLSSNRVRTDIRRGYKRFAGVVEEGMTVGGYTTGTPSAALDELADHMSASLGGLGDPGVYQPAILSFEKVTIDGKEYRRKYATRDEQLEHAAYPVEWAAYPQVRSQVSRQYGRGS